MRNNLRGKLVDLSVRAGIERNDMPTIGTPAIGTPAIGTSAIGTPRTKTKAGDINNSSHSSETIS